MKSRNKFWSVTWGAVVTNSEVKLDASVYKKTLDPVASIEWRQLYIRQQILAIQDNQRYSVQWMQKEERNHGGRIRIWIFRSKKLERWRQPSQMFRPPLPSKCSSWEETLLQTQIQKRCSTHSLLFFDACIQALYAYSIPPKAICLGESGSWGISDLGGEAMDFAGGEESGKDSCREGQSQIVE